MESLICFFFLTALVDRELKKKTGLHKKLMILQSSIE